MCNRILIQSIKTVLFIFIFHHTKNDESNLLFVNGLKLEKLVVAETAIFDGSETLTCDFAQETDQLLSLKWFKDGHEFFRFLPNEDPQISTFDVPGFVVHGQNASLNRVTIKSLTLNASGIYRCEILADKPSFQTLFKEGNLTVIVPPEPQSPTINNISSMVLMGETLNGTCISKKSLPPALLTFYINEQKMESPNIVEYHPIVEPKNQHGLELQTSILGLRIKVSHKYFRRGKISIKCIARIGQRSWITYKIVQHLNNFPSHLSNYGKPKRSSSKTSGMKTNLNVVFIILLLWLVFS